MTDGPQATTGDPQMNPGILGLAVFLAELCLIAAAAIAGWGLGHGTASKIVYAVILPLCVIVLWSRWFAPRSRFRAAYPRRLIAKDFLVVAVAAMLYPTATIVGSVILVVVIGGLFTVGEIRER